MSNKTRLILGAAVLVMGFLLAGCHESGSIMGPEIVTTDGRTLVPHDPDSGVDEYGRRGAKSPEELEIR